MTSISIYFWSIEDDISDDKQFLNNFNLDVVIQLANYINAAYCMYIVGCIPGKEVFKELPHYKIS